MRVSQTANLGMVDSMHRENTYARYLLDLGRLLKEEAMQARQQAKGAPDDDKLFQEGRLLAYNEIVSLMQQQAIAFGLPLDSIGLQGIDPDADLV